MPRVDSGFTLIEVLVVVVIVGVLALALTISIAGDATRRVSRESERFAALVGQACEQAELGGREIGVVVGPLGYSFLRLAGSSWQPASDSGELRARRWVSGIEVELSREGRRVDLDRAASPAADGDAALPELVCFSSGELTPFRLTLALGDAPRWRVDGHDDATLAVARVEER